MRRCWPVLLLLVPALALAAKPAPKQGDQDKARMYRYKDADGTLTIGNQLTQQAIYAGYQVLDEHGRVIKTVAPQPPEAQAERRQALQERQQAEEQARRDKELERIYGTPEDAARARDRQIEALKLKVSYAENSLGQLQDKRDDAVHDAAEAERAGREVSQDTRDAIDRYNRQIDDTHQKIQQYRQDMDQVRRQFEPIIDRLKRLQG